MSVLETDRLVLDHLVEDDAPFILGLLNEPSFLRYIGDKGVRTLEGARDYLHDGPLASYAENGYGLYRVTQRCDGEPVGICGLVRRDTLPHADIGFAFLPPYWSRGYASEAAAAVRRFAHETLGLDRLLAITSQDNHGSIRVLEKIGLRFDSMLALEADRDPVRLFVADRA